MRTLLLLILVMTTAVSSCKRADDSALENAADQAGVNLKGSLTIVGGNDQTVSLNEQSTNKLEVIALDQSGQPKSGVPIKFEVMTSSAGLLDDESTSKTVTSLASGKAGVFFTASNYSGEVVVLATSTYGVVTFTVNTGGSVSSGTNSGTGSLIITGGNNQSVITNTNAAQSLEVIALDGAGQPISGVNVKFEVMTSSGGLLTGGVSTKNVSTESSGKAAVSFAALSFTGEVVVLVTSNAGNSSFKVNVLPQGSSTSNTNASSSLLIIGGNGQSVTAGQSASTPLQVIALNSDGAPVPNTSVRFEILTANSGILNLNEAMANATTNSVGKASVNYQAGTFTGDVIIMATSSLGSATFSIPVISASASGSASSLNSSLIVVGGNNQNVTIESAASSSLQVIALDSSGAPLAGVPVSFEIMSAAAGYFSATGNATIYTKNTASNGKASIDYVAGSNPGDVIVLATSSAGNTSFTLHLVEAASSSSGSTTGGSSGTSPSSGSSLLVVGGSGQIVAPSQAGLPLEVIALDSSGSPLAGVDVTFQVMTALGGNLGAGATSKTVTTASNGKIAVPYTAGTYEGNVSILATSSAGYVSFSTTVQAASSGSSTGGSSSGGTSTSSPSTLLIVGGNNQIVDQNTTAANPLEVIALDGSGLPIAGLDIKFEIMTSNGGTLSSASSASASSSKTISTGSNGKATVTFNAPLNYLGTVVILVTSTAGSATFNESIGVVGSGSSISISGGNGQIVSPGTLASQPLEVIVTSSSGAPIAGVSVSFSVTTNNGGLLETAFTNFAKYTDSNGKASVSFTASNTSGPVTVLASSSVGTANFSLNTQYMSGGSGGPTIAFNPSTLSPASGTWATAQMYLSFEKTVQIANASNMPIYVNSIFTTTNTPFRVVSDSCPRTPTLLAAAGTCSMTISFTPDAAAAVSRFAFVNWSYLNDGSSAQNAVLNLEGTGPAPLNFGGLVSVNLNASSPTNKLDLSWVTIAGAMGYNVYRINDGIPNLIAMAAAAASTFTDTGLSGGTSYKYRVRSVNSAGVEDSNTVDRSATTSSAGLPVLTNLADKVYPSTEAVSRTLTINPNNYTVYAGISGDWNNIAAGSPGNDTTMSYTCLVSNQVTGLEFGKINCATFLNGTYGSFNFSSTTAALTWYPAPDLQGTWEFLIKGTNTGVGGSHSRFWKVNLGYSVIGNGLIADYRSAFSDTTVPNISNEIYWDDIFGNRTATITGSPMWAGSITNEQSNPLRLTLNSTTQVNLGPLMNGLAKFNFDLWMSNPINTFTDGSIVMTMDSTSSDKGFVMKQKNMYDGSKALSLDFTRSYRNNIMISGQSPSIAYWRLEENSGTNFNEEMNNLDAIYGDGSYGTTTTNGITYSQISSSRGDLASRAIKVHTNRLNLPNSETLKPDNAPFSIEMWVRYDNTSTPSNHDLYTYSDNDVTDGINFSIDNGILTVKYKPRCEDTVTITPDNLALGHLFDKNWHHIAFTVSQASKILFIDGNPVATHNHVLNEPSTCPMKGFITWPAVPTKAWLASGADETNPLHLDEVAIYPYGINSTMIKSHVALGDHFNINQANYPANGQFQSRPLGYWRLSAPQSNNKTIFQDASLMNQDLICNLAGTVVNPGVYKRTLGLSQDTDNAISFSNDNRCRVIQNTRMVFDQELTFSSWVETSSTSAVTKLMSINNYAADTSGIYVMITSDGYLRMGFDNTLANPDVNYVQSSYPVAANGTSITPGWNHIAVTFNATLPATERVGLYLNGVAVKTSVVGTIPASLSALTGPSRELQIGTLKTLGSTWFSNNVGNIDEAALYNRMLSGHEIRAQAMEGSLRTIDFNITTLSTEVPATMPFDNISIHYDNPLMRVFWNGNLVQAMRPAITTFDNLDIVVGDSSNGFKGHLYDVKVYGHATSILTPSEVYKNFFYAAEKHRPKRAFNGVLVSHTYGHNDLLYSDNLKMNFSASSAMDGIRPHYSDNGACPRQQYLWSGTRYPENSVTTLDTRQNTAWLKNFGSSSCTSSAWQGSMFDVQDPYRLNFDGIDDWVDLGSDVQGLDSYWTSCVWHRTSQNSTGKTIPLLSKANSSGSQYFLGIDNNQFKLIFKGTSGTRTISTPRSAATYNNKWVHLCASNYSHMGGLNNMSLWVNGTAFYLGNHDYNPVHADVMNNPGRFSIGVQADENMVTSGPTFQGEIGSMQFYTSSGFLNFYLAYTTSYPAVWALYQQERLLYQDVQ
jgi:hypothetical protein